MSVRAERSLAVAIAIALVGAAVAVLSITPTVAATCPKDGGEDPPSDPSGSPSGSSTPSSSPSESDDGLPITLPPPIGEEESATPSPSGTGTPPGNDATVRCKSRISINYDPARRGRDRFKGRVGSGHDACKAERVVFLKKKRRGKDALVGRDRTTRKGRWLIREHRARGRFYARVAPTRLDSGVRCQGDRSGVVRARRR